MNERDLDLILALAEERLTGDERREAEARVAADPTLARELEMQRYAIASIGRADPVSMTDDERGALRASLRSELGLEQTSAAAPSRRTARLRWLVPAMGVAAVVVVGIVVVGNNLGGSDDAALPAGEDALSADEMSESDGGADVTTTMAASAEAAPTATTTVPRLQTFGVQDLDEAVEEDDLAALGAPRGTEIVDVTVLEDCRGSLPELANLDEPTVRAVTTVDGRDVVLVSFPRPDGTADVVAIDLATCELVSS